MTDSKLDHIGQERRALIRKRDAVGWGMGLLGMGIITLGVQMTRMRLNLPIEGFGLAMGIFFLVAGAWEMLQIKLGQEPIPDGLLPVLSIVAGVALIVSALLRKRH